MVASFGQKGVIQSNEMAIKFRKLPKTGNFVSSSRLWLDFIQEQTNKESRQERHLICKNRLQINLELTGGQTPYERKL